MMTGAVASRVNIEGRGHTTVWTAGPPDGAPVVLLHGWTVKARWNWQPLLDRPAPGWRVIAPDQRGHADGAGLTGAFDLDACAADVAGLIDSLDLAPPVLAGYSMGGAVAQLVGRRYPASVSGLVLCATASRFPVMNRSVRALMSASGFLVDRPRVRRRPERRSALRLPGRRLPLSTRTLIDSIRALDDFDSAAWLDRLTLPSAVVVTDADTSVLPSEQRRLAELLPDARIFPVAGGHRVVVDAPDLFAPVFWAGCADVVGRRLVRWPTGSPGSRPHGSTPRSPGSG